MNTLRDLLLKEYGVKTDVKEKTVALSQSPVQVLENNPNRLSYLIGNPSTGTVYAAHSAALVSSTSGVPVGGGNALAGDWRVDFDVVGYELWMVANSGSPSVFVYEVVTAGQP